MDAGNMLLIVAIGGIGIYAIMQSQKRTAAEEIQLQAIALERERNIAKASKRSIGEHAGGLGEALIRAVW